MSEQKEQPIEYVVDISKTLWAASVRLRSEMDKIKAELVDSLPVWGQRLARGSRCR